MRVRNGLIKKRKEIRTCSRAAAVAYTVGMGWNGYAGTTGQKERIKDDHK